MATKNVVGTWHGLRTWEQSVQSFWDQVVKTDYCWIWTGNRNIHGYGQYDMPGMSYRTHRASWQMHCGPIPQGMYVLHRCDNPSCVRPDHLFLGTQTDNMRDAASKGRIKLDHKAGEHHPNAKLTEWQARRIKELVKSQSHTSIAKEFNIARSVVTRISLGQLWKSLSG